MRIYLSGPMTGYPQFNYPAFADATKRMRKAGFTVFTPHEFLTNAGTPSQADLRRAFAAYCKFICEEAEAVVVLDGWTKSKGATCEVALARNCGIPVVALDAATGHLSVVPNVPLRSVAEVSTPFPNGRDVLGRAINPAREDRTPYGDS